MSERIKICEGRVIDPANQVDKICDIYIADGKILSVGVKPDSFDYDRLISANGLWVLPGLVDLHARLQPLTIKLSDNGSLQLNKLPELNRSDCQQVFDAAVKGGITTFCCPPDLSPCIDTALVAQWIQHEAKASRKVRVLPQAALTQGLKGRKLTDIIDLIKTSGCVGVSHGRFPPQNTELLRQALRYAASQDILVFVCAQESWLAKAGCVHEGAVATRLGLPGIPALAEVLALSRLLCLIEDTGVRAHVSRLSTAQGIKMLKQAIERGLSVTGDVAIASLFLTDSAVLDFNTAGYVLPPFRSLEDRQALRQGWLDGSISAVCSNHSPVNYSLKKRLFLEAVPGMLAFDGFLPLTLQLASEQNKRVSEALSSITIKPAKILGMQSSGMGSLTPGKPADICLFDPLYDHSKMSDQSNHSRKWLTPLAGYPSKGKVVSTLYAGSLVFSHADSNK